MKIFLTPLSIVMLSLALHFPALGQSSFYGEVTVTDTYNDAPLSMVSDSLNSGKYRDFNLTGGDPCVSAFGASSFLMYPQRSNCTVATPRNFYIYFPEEATSDPDFPQECKINFDWVRQQYYFPAWRMYFPELFATLKGKQSTTTLPTEVLFGFYCGNGALSVQTDVKLTPIVTGSTRRLLNVGDNAVRSSLYYPMDGNFYRLGVDNFTFTFDINVENLGSGSTGGGKGKPSR